MKSELSDPLFHELKQSNPDRESALTIYRQRDPGWESMANPVALLRDHPLVDDDGKPGPSFLETWLGVILVIAIIGGIVFAVFTLDLKFVPYFSQLFVEKDPARSISLSERPEETSLSRIPAAYRDPFKEINANIAAEQWEPAVRKALILKSDPAAIAAFRSDPAAFTRLYEVLIGGKMALRSSGTSDQTEVLDLVNEFRKANGQDSIKIAYNEILARFEIAGGETVGLPRTPPATDLTVLRECDSIQNKFGSSLTLEQAAKLRAFRVYSLIRILSADNKLSQIQGNPSTQQRWKKLSAELNLWRGKFPNATTAKEQAKQWKAKPRDFLKCDLWYWQKVSKLEPLVGKQIKIGDMTFDGNSAAYNAKRIGEALGQ